MQKKYFQCTSLKAQQHFFKKRRQFKLCLHFYCPLFNVSENFFVCSEYCSAWGRVLFTLCKETQKNREIKLIFSIKTCTKTWNLLAHRVYSDRQKSILQVFFLSLNASSIIRVRVFSTAHPTRLSTREPPRLWHQDTPGRQPCTALRAPHTVPILSSQLPTQPGGSL